jgi:hypothetical protein
LLLPAGIVAIRYKSRKKSFQGSNVSGPTPSPNLIQTSDAKNSGKDIIGNSYNPSKSTPTKGDSGDVSRLNVIPFAAENIVNTNDDEQIDSNEEDEENDN